MAHPRDKRHLAPVCSRLHTLQVASSGERLPDETAPLKVDCSLIVRLSGKIIWISVWPIEAAHSAPIAVRYPPSRHRPQTIVTLMGRVFSSSASNITFRLAANVLHTSRFIYLLVIMVTKSMLTIFPESSHIWCVFFALPPAYVLRRLSFPEVRTGRESSGNLTDLILSDHLTPPSPDRGKQRKGGTSV